METHVSYTQHPNTLLAYLGVVVLNTNTLQIQFFWWAYGSPVHLSRQQGQIYKYTNIQIYKYTNIQIYKYTKK